MHRRHKKSHNMLDRLLCPMNQFFSSLQSSSPLDSKSHRPEMSKSSPPLEFFACGMRSSNLFRATEIFFLYPCQQNQWDYLQLDFHLRHRQYLYTKTIQVKMGTVLNHSISAISMEIKAWSLLGHREFTKRKHPGINL
jgi:hypothetical protein